MKKGQTDIITAIVSLVVALAIISAFGSFLLREDYKTRYDKCEGEKAGWQQAFESQKNQTIICNDYLRNVSNELIYYKNITNTTGLNVTVENDYWQNVSIQFVFISIFFIFYFMIGLTFKLFDINIEIEIEDILGDYMGEKWAKVFARLIKILIVLVFVFIVVLIWNLLF